MEYFEMNIAGLKRKLQLCPVSDKVTIAAFILFGDVEITVAAAKELLDKVGEFDIILTPEAKSIPLAYEMSRQSGKKYLVARKGKKVYTIDPLEVEVKSITTNAIQHLYLSCEEAELLRGRRVLVLDDVISTGESLKAVESMVEKAGGIVAARAAVLAEGDAADRDDIIFLEKLPLFITE